MIREKSSRCSDSVRCRYIVIVVFEILKGRDKISKLFFRNFEFLYVYLPYLKVKSIGRCVENTLDCFVCPILWSEC